MDAKLPVLPVSKSWVGEWDGSDWVAALKSAGSIFVLSESSNLALLPGSAGRTHSWTGAPVPSVTDELEVVTVTAS